MQENLRERIAKQFQETRKRTLQIFDLAEETVLHESPGFGFRPILWHLAHMGVFEEFWLLNRIAGENPINERFQIIFDPIKIPREASKNLPSKAEMLAFLNRVREGSLRVLETADFASKNPLLQNGYIFDLVLQHELQHQETLAYLFHLLPNSAKTGRIASGIKINRLAVADKSAIEFPAAESVFGASGGSFAYDNEMPRHAVFIPGFKLDRFLTTNSEFAEFIAEKGYQRSEFWSAEGWNFKEKENWNAPLYWRKVGEHWAIRQMFNEQPLSVLRNHPVYGISFYEAEAYARFCGKRLPTEFEWERAASLNFLNSNPTSKNCNFGFYYWNMTPVDCFEQTNGIFDLSGNLWEWTTSDFAPYPNFRAFPYPEYSEEWFDGDHKVLRGGSWATSAEILRLTFRNFFRRHFRIAFAGIRLAQAA